MELSSLVLANLRDRRHDAAAVEQRLVAGLAEARSRWPGVEVDDARFAAWLVPRLAEGAASVEDALDALRLPDLYLACACAAGDPRALAAFDAAFVATDARSSDDVKQALRQKLFVGPEPRIASYAGRGELGRWVRAVAARLAIDEARSVREVPTEDALLDAIGLDPEHGPAQSVLKQDARAVLQAAIREAIAALSPRERTLLLQYYIDGVGVAELGKLFDLAPSNISRTLARARVTLLAQIRRSVMRHKKLTPHDLDSLIDLVGSQLSVTGGLRGA